MLVKLVLNLSVLPSKCVRSCYKLDGSLEAYWTGSTPPGWSAINEVSIDAWWHSTEMVQRTRLVDRIGNHIA